MLCFYLKIIPFSQAERGEKLDVLSDKERADKHNAELVNKMNADNALLTQLLTEAKQQATDNQGQGVYPSAMRLSRNNNT